MAEDVGKIVKTVLLAESGVTDLVAARVDPMLRVQGEALPSVVYQEISGAFVQTLDGPTDLVLSRVQVTSWAATYAGAHDLAAAVRAALDGYTGTAGTIAVSGVEMADQGDMAEPEPEADEARVFGVRQDYEVWFKP